MKKVVCIFLSFLLLFSGAFTCFASSDDLTPVEGFTTWDDVSADGKALAEAYINTIKSVGSGDIVNFFKTVSDIPLSYLKMLSDGTLVLSPVDDIYYYLKNGTLYVHNYSGHGGGGGDRPGEGSGSGSEDYPVSEPSDFYIKSDDLTKYIEEQNTTNTPKGTDLFKQSYWTEKHWHSFEAVQYVNVEYDLKNSFLPLFDDTKKTPFSDLYLVPFYSDENGVQYYSNYQYHLYYIPCDDPNADFSLYLDIYFFSDSLGYVLQSNYSGWVADFTADMMPYSLTLGQYIFSNDRNGYGAFPIVTFSLESYSLGKVVTWYNIIERGIPDAIAHYFSNDGVDKFLIFHEGYSDVFTTTHNNTKVKPNEDLGFVCSKSLIKREHSIDTSKIPPNQVINITGDTIYDYSITNPDTGASTTINNYVTNNYVYPEVPGTSEPSGGGSGVGGNVTVGGNIGVGGQVGVDINVSVPDININVNQGSGAGGSGTGINPDDILDGSSVDLDKYYDDAISQASGVRSFLSQFFDFLPAEIVGLLGILIAVAIVCRLFGR